MFEIKEREELSTGMRKAWIIWGKMLGSFIPYISICYLMGDDMIIATTFYVPIELLRYILYGTAAVELILTYFLRKRMLAAAPEMHESKLRILLKFIRNNPSYVAKYLCIVFVSLLISESIGLYGFVFFTLGGDFKTLCIFSCISALAMFFYRPRFEELEQLAIAIKQKTHLP